MAKCFTLSTWSMQKYCIFILFQSLSQYLTGTLYQSYLLFSKQIFWNQVKYETCYLKILAFLDAVNHYSLLMIAK